MQKQSIVNHIVSWLQAYSNKSNTNGFVIGVSGGIDSAVTSTLGAKTGMPLICVEMPIHQAQSQVDRAEDHIAWLRSHFDNVSVARVELTKVFDDLVKALPESKEQNLALANTRARLRMTTLYHVAAQHGMLVLGTGNKVEDFGIGFYTKYGDGGVDLSPIADLNKTEVYSIGKHMGIKQRISDSPPAEGLWGDDRTDEDQIGASYPELEWAMEFSAGEEELNPRQREVLKIYRRLNQANKHKMVPIPVCEIPQSLR